MEMDIGAQTAIVAAVSSAAGVMAYLFLEVRRLSRKADELQRQTLTLADQNMRMLDLFQGMDTGIRRTLAIVASDIGTIGRETGLMEVLRPGFFGDKEKMN